MNTETVKPPPGWTVVCLHGRWMASHPEHGYLQDRVDGGYDARYDTRAELLKHLAGEGS